MVPNEIPTEEEVRQAEAVRILNHAFDHLAPRMQWGKKPNGEALALAIITHAIRAVYENGNTNMDWLEGFLQRQQALPHGNGTCSL